jgi:hypothetical protein
MVSEYGANAGVSGSLSVSGSVTFKGESDVNVDSNTLFVDASANSVGVGTTAPIASLDVAGKIAISSESSTPSQPADGKGYLYTKTDGKLYWRSYDLGETDLTAGGGSDTDTFVTDNFGFFKFTNDNLHGHPTYVNKSRYDQINMNLSGKVTYGTDVDGDTFTATIVNSILYVKNGIVPVACTLDSFTVQGYLVEAMSNGNAQFSLWQGAVPSDATAYSTDVTWTRIGTVTWGGTGADDTWYKGTDTLTSGNSFSAGDWWAITVQPGGTDTALSSGNSSYFASMVWSPTS